jgi:DNA-binding PadR family transcriptional regulator
MPAGEDREFRGYILSMCKTNYPYGCSKELIGQAAADMAFAFSPAEISGHIEYMREKGYVRVEELQSGRNVREIVKITAKGIDLLNGHIPEDPGILIPL